MNFCLFSFRPDLRKRWLQDCLILFSNVYERIYIERKLLFIFCCLNEIHSCYYSQSSFCRKQLTYKYFLSLLCSHLDATINSGPLQSWIIVVYAEEMDHRAPWGKEPRGYSLNKVRKILPLKKFPFLVAFIFLVTYHSISFILNSPESWNLIKWFHFPSS